VTTTTHCDSGEKSLGHVSDDDADKEDDGVEPLVAEDERDDEERDSKEHCDGSDDVDEMSDLASYRRLADLEATRQVRNPPHHSPITSVDY